MQAAEIWFNAPLHRKLMRLIEIARLGQNGSRAIEIASDEAKPVALAPFNE